MADSALTQSARSLLGRWLTQRQREALAGYVFISPWLIGFLGLTLFPIGFSLVMAFMRWPAIGRPRWIALSNFQRMFSDGLVWHSLRVTLYYVVISAPLGVVIGLAIALLMNTKIPGVNVFRTAYYLPSLVTMAAQAVLWYYVFQPKHGLLNVALGWFGIRGPAWLASPSWVMPAFVIMGMWHVGGAMVTYLAGLQSVPTEMYESAKIDGANLFQRLMRITLPMISPVIFYNLIQRIIGCFQVFALAYMLFGGARGGDSANPARHAAHFYMLYLYEKAFLLFEFGYASALAWFLFIIILAATLLVFRSSSAWVFYQGELRE